MRAAILTWVKVSFLTTAAQTSAFIRSGPSRSLVSKSHRLTKAVDTLTLVPFSLSTRKPSLGSLTHSGFPRSSVVGRQFSNFPLLLFAQESFRSSMSPNPRKKKASSTKKKHHARRHAEDDESESRPSLRTSHDVLNRLKYDSTMYDPNQIIIGYDDRIHGPMETFVSDFVRVGDNSAGEGDIPEHRIQYFRRQVGPTTTTASLPAVQADDILWDRKSRIDRIFQSGETSTTSIDPETWQAIQTARQTMHRLEEEQLHQMDIQNRNQAARNIRRQLAQQAMERYQQEEDANQDMAEAPSDGTVSISRQTSEVREQLEAQSIDCETFTNTGKDEKETTTSSASLSSGSSRKRSMDQLVSHAKRSIKTMTGNGNNETQESHAARVATASPPTLADTTRIRLEAIFHPKFDNEGDKKIRMAMQEKVQQGDGYLEVSLKHSGSLLLWSGGQRYYSKNSMDNKFTHVGEILLRQHFIRAFWNDQDDSKDTEGDTNMKLDWQAEAHYHECSDFVESQRLTLAFEVVTAVLGDHGDKPKRDFLILTAVADRTREQFYSTAQVVALAQRFRLPHNDFWQFTSPKSTKALFEFYDHCRETSLASFVEHTLTKAAETRVRSLYPHTEFQGDILEGIVIRYVPHPENSKEPMDENEINRDMPSLARVADDLCSKKIPSSLPDCFELITAGHYENKLPKCLSTDLRTIFAQMRSATNDEAPNSFASKVKQLLETPDRRIGVRMSQSATKHVASVLRKLRDSDDVETRRIAQVIEDLDRLNIRVDYSIVREEITNYGFSRWLCIIHVILDHAHSKYRKSVRPGDMALFRGFALELSADDEFSANELSHNQTTFMSDLDEEKGLMLKMKFLLYMVRTFGCRNGLKHLKQGGSEGFVKYTSNLLTKWKMSSEARKTWMPFFRAWADYAAPRLSKYSRRRDAGLQPLSQDNYLEHLEQFIELYDAGKIERSGDSFNGFVVVVGPDEDTAKTAADYVAKQVGCKIRYDGLSAVPNGTTEGAVCSVCLEDSSGRYRNILKGRLDDKTAIVYYGCEWDEILSVVGEDKVDNVFNRLNGWRKNAASVKVDLPLAAIPSNDAMEIDEDSKKDTETLLKPIMQFSKTDDLDDIASAIGILVFFPQIPGCGKSSLIDESAELNLHEFLSKRTEPRRNLKVRMGDKTPGKYWQVVTKEKRQDISSLYIADKNVPSGTWDALSGICADTSSVGVPAIPEHALSTTVVQGFRKRDGEICMDRTYRYPFSLTYLAVCMLRVMSRPPNSHPGKLDQSHKRACMIVVMFYCLYERETADEFLASLSAKFENAGAFIAREPIEIPFFESPFFRSDEVDIPTDLKNILVEAIQARNGFKDVGKEKDEYLDDLESRLRTSLEENQTYLNSLTVGVEVSQQAFLDKVKKVVELADQGEIFDHVDDKLFQEDLKKKATRMIDYVSVDVSVDDVHNLLLKNVDDRRLESLWKKITGKNSANDVLVGSLCADKKFVLKTHVTLVHKVSASQDEMRLKYGEVEGHGAEVIVRAVLWDGKTAALEVELPKTTDEGTSLPASFNKFTHITLWRQSGTVSARSNSLPDLVEKGKAQRVELSNTAKLKGRITL